MFYLHFPQLVLKALFISLKLNMYNDNKQFMT